MGKEKTTIGGIGEEVLERIKEEVNPVRKEEPQAKVRTKRMEYASLYRIISQIEKSDSTEARKAILDSVAKGMEKYDVRDLIEVFRAWTGLKLENVSLSEIGEFCKKMARVPDEKRLHFVKILLESHGFRSDRLNIYMEEMGGLPPADTVAEKLDWNEGRWERIKFFFRNHLTLILLVGGVAAVIAACLPLIQGCYRDREENRIKQEEMDKKAQGEDAMEVGRLSYTDPYYIARDMIVIMGREGIPLELVVPIGGRDYYLSAGTETAEYEWLAKTKIIVQYQKDGKNFWLMLDCGSPTSNPERYYGWTRTYEARLWRGDYALYIDGKPYDMKKEEEDVRNELKLHMMDVFYAARRELDDKTKVVKEKFRRLLREQGSRQEFEKRQLAYRKMHMFKPVAAAHRTVNLRQKVC